MTVPKTDQLRRVIVIAGPHRSGTSAITRVLNLLGAEIARDLDPGNEFNETGHWEPRRVQELDDRLLAELGLRWDDWQPTLPSDALAGNAHLQAEAVNILRTEHGDAPLFVMKDPRMCRLLPFWQAAFSAAGLKDVYVLPIRAPLEAARSLNRRDKFSIQIGLAIWAANMFDAEQNSRGKQRVFTTYDELQDDWRSLADHVTRETGIEFPLRHDVKTGVEIDAFINPEHRHHRTQSSDDTGDTALHRLAQALHDALLQLRSDPNAAGVLARIDRLRTDFEAAIPERTLLTTDPELTRDVGLIGDAPMYMNDGFPTRLAVELRLAAAEQSIRRELRRVWRELDQTLNVMRTTSSTESEAIQVAALNRIVETILRIEQALDRPARTLKRTLAAGVLTRIAELPGFPQAYRAKFLRAARRRDPKLLTQELHRHLSALADTMGLQLSAEGRN